jgi:hypothetical protein
MSWEFVIYLIISITITAALTPKAQSRPPEAFEDIDFPQADEGTPQCVIFGDCWSGDWTVLAVGNYRTSEIRGSGGK